MGAIAIRNLYKSYPTGSGNDPLLRVIDDFNLDIADGEFVTFFGPNASGKTTLLKIIAGITPYDSGVVNINDQTPDQAPTGFVFQNYAESLMPWLTVKDNALFAYSLRARRQQRQDAERRLLTMLADLRLSLPLDAYPYQLSGGQQQLVSILRTLIYKPDVILMDEPFSSLDHQTRADMQTKIHELWHHEHSTIIFVSHDLEEAIFLADRLVLLAPRPTSPKAVLTVPFEHPRHPSLLQSDAFFDLKRQALRVMDT